MDGIGIQMNRDKGVALIEQLEGVYTIIGKTITSNWPSVKKVLRTQWIGPAEQDYEEKFVSRINLLYVDAYTMISTTSRVIKEVVNAKVDSENSNTATGTVVESTLTKITREIEITKNESIIDFDKLEINWNEVNTGLVNSTGSASAIHTSVSDFVSKLTTSVYESFEGLDLSAFNGSRVGTAIQSLISKVKTATGEIVTAINDLDKILDSLAGTNYSQTEETVDSILGEISSSAESSTSEISTKWVA